MTAPTVRQAKVPQAKMLRLMFMIRVLTQEPRTVDYLAAVLNINVRSAYRYIKLIESLGYDLKTKNTLAVGREYKKTYYIDKCPCCGKGK